MRGVARDRARRLRTLFHRLPVRGLGGQERTRGARRRHVRYLGRGVSVPQKTLRKFSGRLLLGGAMLDGWIARGLAPKRTVVIEPQPGKAVKALARRGLKLNPKGKAVEAAAIVIAVKPQSAPEAVPPLGAYVGKNTLVLSIMAAVPSAFWKTRCRGAPRSCAPCPTRRPRSDAASASWLPMQKPRRANVSRPRTYLPPLARL